MLNTAYNAKPPLGVTVRRGHPYGRNLTGAWLMNENSGATLYDLTGNGSIATNTNPTWIAQGLQYSSGVRSIIQNTSSLNLTSNFSVLIRCRITTPTNQSRVWARGVAYRPMTIRWRTTNKIEVEGYDSTATSYLITSSHTVNVNDLVNIVVNVTSTQVALYINGQLSGSANITGGLHTGSSGYSWIIGARQTGASNYDCYWPGQVHFVLFYNTALPVNIIAPLCCEPFATFERALGRELLYTLPTGIWLAGSAEAQSAASSTLKQLCSIAGLADAQSQVSALLSRTLVLGGSAGSAAALSALCKIIRQVSGTATGLSDATAQLSAIRQLVASVSGLATVEGTVSITEGILLIGTATGAATLYGILTVSGHLPWFTGSLEIDRPWLREALFNCVSANAFKLGVALSGGWFWVRVSGCTTLYRGADMREVDFANILAVTEQDACEIQPPSYLLHSSNSTYFYVVRRFNNCGYMEYTLGAAVKVSIADDGELTNPQPNNIFCSKTEQIAGSKIHLVWFYCPLEQKSEPERFNIYCNGQTEQINYDNPVATISYQGRKYYNYETIALEAGRYLLAIRAEDANGVENNSLARSRIDMHTTAPDPITILSAEAT
jgi:hypothetical protein